MKTKSGKWLCALVLGLGVFARTAPAEAVWYLWDPNTTGSMATSSTNWIAQNNNDRSGYWVLEGNNTYTSFTNGTAINVENATFSNQNTTTPERINPANWTVNAGGTVYCARMVNGGSAGTLTVNAGGKIITENQPNYLGDTSKLVVKVNGGLIQFGNNTHRLAQHNIGIYEITNGGTISSTGSLLLGGDNNTGTYGNAISRCDMTLGALDSAQNTGFVSAGSIYVGSYNPGTLTLNRGSVTVGNLFVGNERRSNASGGVTTIGTGDIVNYYGTITAASLTLGKSNNSGSLTLAADGGTVSVKNLTVSSVGKLDFQVTPLGVGKLSLQTGGTVTNSGTVQLSHSLTLSAQRTSYDIYEGAAALTVADASSLWNASAFENGKLSISLDSAASAGSIALGEQGTLIGKATGWVSLTGGNHTDPIEFVFTTNLVEADVANFVADLKADNPTALMEPEIWADGDEIHYRAILPEGTAFMWDFSPYVAEYGNVSLQSLGAANVPEPASWLLALLGICGLGLAKKRS